MHLPTWINPNKPITYDVNLLIMWSSNPHLKTPIPEKSSKSYSIGVWYRDNSYLGTNIIEINPPNKYWFVNEKYKDDATKSVVLR
jgi:hypothetical protein